MITCLGNAIVDVMTHISEQDLIDLGLEKSTVTLIDEKQLKSLHQMILPDKRVAGGSVANTAYNISCLGGKSHFIGKVGDDGRGVFFRESMKLNGSDTSNISVEHSVATGCAIVFITPDHERTMCAFQGACDNLLPQHIKNPSFLINSSMFLLEGFILTNTTSYETAMSVTEDIKKNSIPVAVALSDVHCLQSQKERFKEVIERHANIIIGNESEFQILTDSRDIKSEHPSSFPDAINVITLGAKGARIVHPHKSLSITIDPAPLKVPFIDSTGAGDTFAAGFLHAFVSGQKLERCAIAGNNAAIRVLGQYGARIPVEQS